MYQQQQQQPPQPNMQHSQYLQHYQQHYQQPSQVYGSYGNYYNQNVFEKNAWQAYNMSQENELQALFASFVSGSEANTISNGIQSEDLCKILNSTPSIKNYYKIQWSREMCSVLLAMLDRNPDGFMQWAEFLELQRCLLAWHSMFCSFDYDRSGFIESNELAQVIQQFGYRVSPDVMMTLLKRYSRAHSVNGEIRTLIAFDDFVSLCVRLRAYTDAFRSRDRQTNGGQETGKAVLGYDDFLRCVMCL